MFSISDIKQEAYPAAYRRGKELYERGLVQEFSYAATVRGFVTMRASANTVLPLRLPM